MFVLGTSWPVEDDGPANLDSYERLEDGNRKLINRELTKRKLTWGGAGWGRGRGHGGRARRRSDPSP